MKDNLFGRICMLKIPKDSSDNTDFSSLFENMKNQIEDYVRDKMAQRGTFVFTPLDLMDILKTACLYLINNGVAIWGDKKISPKEFLANFNLDDMSIVEENPDRLFMLNDIVLNILPKYLPKEIINDIFNVNITEDLPETKITDFNGNTIWVLNRDWEKQLEEQFIKI
jgi:hypothetical protein